MDEEELKELEDPATWADDEGYVLPPSKNPGAVFSVRFSLSELEMLHHAGISQGLNTIDFIRQAALEKAYALDDRKQPTPVRRPA